MVQTHTNNYANLPFPLQRRGFCCISKRTEMTKYKGTKDG